MARPLAMVALLALLVSTNLIFYTPQRLQMMRGLYGMERSDLDPFLTPEAQKLTPALIVVHPPNWMEYGVLLELQDPYLDTPFMLSSTGSNCRPNLPGISRASDLPLLP
jgi:hypothetical protein